MLETLLLTVKDYRLHCIAAGHGPLVLLLHGFAGSADEWLPTVRVLATAGYRAVAVDALGFGRSAKPTDADYGLALQADLYNDLIPLLGADRAVLLAHSMGGKFAVATAVLHPQRVAGLVLAGSDGFVQSAHMAQAGMVDWLGDAMLRFAARPQFIRQMLASTFYRPESYLTDEILSRSRKAIGDPAYRAALVALSARYNHTDLRATGIYARLNEISAPTLLVWGDHDVFFDLNCAHEAQRAIPTATLAVMRDCGHFPQIEAARAFRGLLLGFLARQGMW